MTTPAGSAPGPHGAATDPGAVYRALRDEITGGSTIDLAAAAARQTALAGLSPALHALRRRDHPFPLGRAQAFPPVDGVARFTATGGYALPGAGAPSVTVDVLVEFTAAGGVDQFTVKLDVLDQGWTFASTFPALPPTTVRDADNVAVVGPSVLAAMAVLKPVLTATARAGAEPQLRLTGQLPAGPALAPYADFFGPWPLELDGTLDLPADAAEMLQCELVAGSGRAAVPFGPFTLDGFGLILRCVVGPPPELPLRHRLAYAQILVRAEVRLSGDAAAPAAVATAPLLTSDDVWALTADLSRAPLSVGDGLAAVARLLGIEAEAHALAAVPGLPAVAGFAITEIAAGVVSPFAGGPAVDTFGITFSSRDPWAAPIPFVTVRDLGMSWLVRWTGGTPAMLTGSFFGWIDVGEQQLRRAVERTGSARAARALDALIAERDREQDRPRAQAGAVAEPAEPADPLFTLGLTTAYPGWPVAGRLLDGEIPLDAALLFFFGVAAPQPDLSITALSFSADPYAQTFGASADLTTDLSLTLLGGARLTLTAVSLEVDSGPGALTGGLAASFRIGAADAHPGTGFTVSAEYTHAADDGGAGWVFAGALDQGDTLDLTALLAGFAGVRPPAWLPQVVVEELDVRFAFGSGAFAVRGAAGFGWAPQPFPGVPPIAVRAEVEAARTAAGAELTATLRGELQIGRLAVEAALALDGDGEVYAFTVRFGELWFTAVSTWREDPAAVGATDAAREPADSDATPASQEVACRQARADVAAAPRRVLTFQVGGTTLGAVLEYLVALAAPGAGFRLEPPWDVLGRIELDRFTVTVDPGGGDGGSVEIAYRADVSLPMMELETVGVRVGRRAGRTAVELILTGGFLDRRYDEKRPLSWDLLRQSAPAVPAAGSSVFELRYLGIGQRVAPAAPLPGTVRAALDGMAGVMRPVPPDRNPLRSPGGAAMRYAADAQWLIGFDASVAGVLDLAVVFQDPVLYGLAVGLRGARAGALAGLSFEVLYKKVADGVGVFRVELRVPEAFRRIELGAVSVTLGVIVVEVYTDGSFLVDLGFPHGLDFARSFSVEVAPFLGRGGLYFGALDAAAGSRVPAVRNGRFGPVVALGVGLVAGVGREVRSGPLSGGAFLELIAVFEGVFGWFVPDGAHSGTELYHRVEATVAVHGKVYGSVDFAVLRASITIEAWATVTVTLEAYRATRVALSASVEVNASIEVLFIRLSFQFSASIDLGFTLGEDRPAPWILADGGTGGTGPAHLRAGARRALPPPRRRPEVSGRLLAEAHRRAVAAAAALAEDRVPKDPWDPETEVFPTTPRTAAVFLLPFFSVSDIPITGAACSTADAAAPVHRVAFCLFAENGAAAYAPGTPPPPATARDSSQARTAAGLPAQQLVEALLRWCLAAACGAPFGPDAQVTAGQLGLVAEELAGPGAADGPFAPDRLSEFFATNLHLAIAADPGGAPLSLDAVAVPLPPLLNWVSPQLPARDFGTYNPVGPRYTAGVARRAARFQPGPPPPTGAEPPDDPAAYRPFATLVFRDWCLMVARTAVRAATEALAGWQVTLETPTKLFDIADSFPTAALPYVVRAGDTLDSVADALGATPAQLAYRNPELARELRTAKAGANLTVQLGVSPETVAADAAGLAVTAGLTAPLGTVDYPVAEADTLAKIAARFGLPGPAALFDGLQQGLAADPRLLRAGAGLTTPGGDLPGDPDALLAAAVYFVHYFAPTGLDTAWYAQAIAELNDELPGGTEPIPDGIGLLLPDGPQSSRTRPYESLPGDSIPVLAAALALAYGFPGGGGGPDQWPYFRGAVTAQPGGRVRVPSMRIEVQPGESFGRLGLRTVQFADDLPGLAGWLGAAEILNPLFLLPVRGATVQTRGEETLAELAGRVALSVPDLGGRLARVSLLDAAAGAPVVLTVSHLPVQAVDTLVERVIAAAALAVGAESSRQLLSGLSLPEPQPDPDGHLSATGPLRPLAALTGQLVNAPTPDPAQPDQTGLEVTVKVNPSVRPWVTLTGAAVAHGASAQGLPPDLAPFNPAVAADPGRLREGLILRTGPVDQLVYRYTNRELAARYPDGALPLPAPAAVEPLPTAEEVPVSYGLSRKAPLQTAIPLPVPYAEGTLTGTGALWPFPAPLLARARSGAETVYDVWRGDPAGDGPAERIGGTTFATVITFVIRRTEGREHVYELLGADPADRDAALAVYRYAADPDTAPGTSAYLTVLPSPDATDTAGRAVLDGAATDTYVLRTNQSTQSMPPQFAAAGSAAAVGPAAGAAPAADRVAHATLADPAGFCLLLWQTAVTGSAGSVLGYTGPENRDLPPGLFDRTGRARLGLLVIAGEQQREQPARTRLLPINTHLLSAPSLDPDTAALYLTAQDLSETTVRPVLLPGTAGYRLALPDPGEGGSPQERMRRLFSLATAFVPAGPPPGPDDRFDLPSSGLPSGPQTRTDPRLPLGERIRIRDRALAARRAGRAPDRPVPPGADLWWFEQALPVTRFGPPSPAPDGPGLPPAEQDPYRGISGTQPPEAAFRIGFADVLGNTTAVTPGPIEGFTVEAPIGYTDALLGPAAWPAVTLSCAVLPADAPNAAADAENTAAEVQSGAAEIRLVVTLAPQPAATAPGPDPAPARAAALRQAERYAQAYYQLAGGRVSATLLSSLCQLSGGAAKPLPVDAAPLWQFTAAAHAAALAAAAVLPATAGGTLAQIRATYGVDGEDLARANAERPIRALFGPVPPTVPAFAAFAAGDTADALAAADRPGWPQPAGGEALLLLRENAERLPLRPGAVLATPVRRIVLPGAEPWSLAGAARHCATEPGLLAGDNANRRDILRPGFTFHVDDVEVTVPQTAFSLADAAAAFAAVHVLRTPASLAADHADAPGLLRPGAALDSGHYAVVRPEPGAGSAAETLAVNGSGFGAGVLAEANHATPDLYEQGAPIFLGPFLDCPAPGEHETLAGYAARFACPPAQLLAANDTAALPETAAVAVPGAVRLPGPQTGIRVPYSAGPGETLAAAAAKFAAGPRALAAANAGLLTLAGGRTVTVTAGGAPVATQTVAGDGFGSVHARLAAQDPQVTLDLVADALAAVPGALVEGALLLCPPAVLPTPGDALTPRQVGEQYRLDPVLIAEANLGTLGLISPGVDLFGPDGVDRPGHDRVVIAVTAPDDTFNALTYRLARSRTPLSSSDLVAANLDTPFLRAGAALLLPPAPVVLTAPLGAQLGTFARPVFPLETVLRLTRPAGLIDAAFRTADGAGETERADSAVPAPAEAAGDPGSGAGSGSLSLAAFAEAFHAAFPQLRLGTARAGAAGGAAAAARPGPAAAPGGRSADLWVVDFRTDGVNRVAVDLPLPLPGTTEHSPRVLALRPLYRSPISRRVEVRKLLPNGSLDPVEVPTDFRSVDTDLPARRLLADVDLFLSAGLAPALYADPAARDALDDVLDAKRLLAAGIARGLDPVLALTDPDAAAGRRDAAERLSRELAADLSRGYGTTAVVQYRLTVESPWTRGAQLPPARLTGPAQPVANARAAHEARGAAPETRRTPDSGPGSDAATTSAARAADLPPYTLSGAAAALDRSPSNLSFVMTVPDPARHAEVLVDPDYTPVDVQFDIAELDDPAGFEDSSWLAFYPPLADGAKPSALHTRPGAARVPIPLRAYPAQPTLIGHTGGPSAQTDTPTLAESRLWTYAVTYTHEHAEQDEVSVVAEFNVPPAAPRIAPRADDLADALICYDAVADDLWSLLAYYSGARAAVPAEHAVRAAHSFAELVGRAAARWFAHWPALGAPEPADSASDTGAGTGDAATGTAAAVTTDSSASPGDEKLDKIRRAYLVSVQYTDDAARPEVQSVTLTWAEGAPDPTGWPTIACRDAQGADVPLAAGPVQSSVRVYRAEGGGVPLPPDARPVLTLAWPGLPVTGYQNATTRLSVRRNRRLLGPDGPLTRDPFVFETEPTEPPAPVAPLLTWTKPIDITAPGKSFGTALQDALLALAAPRPQLPGTAAVLYRRPALAAATGPADPGVLIPVGLLPGTALDSAAGTLATAADTWLGTAQPPAVPGRAWLVTLTVPSELDPDAPHPLLSYAALIYRL